MKIKSFLASQLEVAAALSGELSRLFVPVKPQPFIDERGHICRQTKKGKVNYGKTLEDKPALKNFAQCCAPYPTESLIYFREAIKDDGYEGSLLVYYEADKALVDCEFTSKVWDRIGDKPCKIPAQIMPREAARIYAKLGEPLVKRVQEVTEAEAIGYGVERAKYTSDFFKPYDGFKDYMPDEESQSFRRAKDSFTSAWELRHPGSFDRNEWLWIYPVTVISTTGKPNK